MNLTVKKGEVIAIKTKKKSALRCNSGGTKILQFQKALPVGGNFRKATSIDGCNLLITAIMK